MRAPAICLTAGLLAALLFAAPLAAREPLMQDGTTSIPERALSRPEARVVKEPGGDALVEEPQPFTLYYLFARKQVGGKEWLEVGPNRSTDPVGWIPAEETVAWKQTLVLTFTNPAGRLPTLFFSDRDKLIDFVEDERLTVLAPDYVAKTRAGSPPPGVGIVSIENTEYVDFVEEFYLLPILQAEQVLLSATAQRSKIFEIASIPLNDERKIEPDTNPDFPVGIVFVIDTTLSMDPFIDRTRETVRKIFETIRGSEIAERVSFGMIGFRDATEGVDGLDYTAKVFAPLEKDFDPDAFLAKIKAINAARVSSRGYNEDGLAGVVEALNLENWKEFGGRYIIYISDAGLRVPPDPLASTGLTVDQVNAMARDRQIAIISMLLRTAAGTAYHSNAEQQLRALSFWRQDWAAPYYEIPDGDLARFGPEIDAITKRLVDQVVTLAKTSAESDEEQAADCGQAGGQTGRTIDCLGFAMRLAWLGRESGAQAPKVFKAWAPQFALDDPVNGRAFQVRILLTRDQVNNLYARLGLAVEAADQLIGQDPGLFFDVLQTVIAQAANDPSVLEDLDPGQNVSFEIEDLPNLGALLGEYFGHLPFKTRLMRTTRDDWDRMSGSDREQILVSVRSARRLLKQYYQDSDRWIQLHPKASDGEKVYPLPLEVLP